MTDIVSVLNLINYGFVLIFGIIAVSYTHLTLPTKLEV